MHPTGHRGAHGQGARSQVDAQGWSGESGRTHSACHYTLAGFPEGLASAFEALGTRLMPIIVVGQSLQETNSVGTIEQLILGNVMAHVERWGN